MAKEELTFLEIAEDFLKAVTAQLDPYTSQKGEIVLDEGSQKATLFTPSHIQFARYGRPAGKQPPVDEILKYVSKKGIVFEGTDQIGTAWAIAKSIAKKGTSNYVKDAPNALEEAIKDSLDEFYKETNEKIFRVFKDQADSATGRLFQKPIKYRM